MSKLTGGDALILGLAPSPSRPEKQQEEDIKAVLLAE